MIPKQLKDALVKLKSSHDKKESVMIKKKHDYEVSLDKVTHQKNIIDYIEGVKKVTPQILFNYGRDKKYVYGQIYYKVNPHTDEKKSFRFMIGKMDDNKSRKQLERICLDTFYDKIIIENVKL